MTGRQRVAIGQSIAIEVFSQRYPGLDIRTGKGMRDYLIDRINKHPVQDSVDPTEACDTIKRTRRVPDAVCVRPWTVNPSVLEIVYIEVEDTSPLTREKLNDYSWMWSEIDATTSFEFTVILLDRYGNEIPFSIGEQYFAVLKAQLEEDRNG